MPRRRTGTESASCPSKNTRPWLGCSSPATMRSSVVLPEPDGPSSATSSLGLTSSDTSESAGAPLPKLLPTWSIVTATVMNSLLIGVLNGIVRKISENSAL